MTGTMRTDRRQAIWDLTKGHCYYCGLDLVADSERQPTLVYRRTVERQMEVDHLIPQKLGGSDDIENTVPCCGLCNTRKGQKSVNDFRFWLMLRTGRPPAPFFGEPSGARRDWLIVASSRIAHVAVPTLSQRIAVFAGTPSSA